MMRKFFSLVTSLVLSSVSSLSSIGCSSKIYFDDRTREQLADANFIMNNSLTLNPNKHVLLIGVDGVPYANVDPVMIDDSAFAADYPIQNYETLKGWTSVLWGNILQKEKNVFNLIKNNNINLKTANITQWMSSYYYNGIYGSQTINYIDDNIDYTNESALSNYDTIDKLHNQIDKLKSETQTKINANYNFIFSYNTYYDELKHQKYSDNDPLILAVIKEYKDLVTGFYNSLNPNDWLVIVVTDHSRDINGNNYNHPDVPISRFSWTLANNNLNTILGHEYTNFYDIRTAAIKWLMQ